MNFVKKTVGITHEDELVKALEILAEKVHPLSLGNVERFVMQSRMIAKKILKTHMPEETDDHKINDIIENMASKLYFHGHPINRREARVDLRLKVAEGIPPQFEDLMWSLYCDFENEFENRTEFNPAVALPMPMAAGTQAPTHEAQLVYAIIESTGLSSAYRSRRRYTLLPGAQPGQTGIREDILEQGWNHSPAPAP